MQKTYVTKRSIVVNLLASLVANTAIKAFLIALLFAMVFPNQLEIEKVIIVGLIWQIGHMIHFDPGIRETVTETTTTTTEPLPSWLDGK